MLPEVTVIEITRDFVGLTAPPFAKQQNPLV